MRSFYLITKFSLAGIFLAGAFLLQAGSAAGQSTDAAHPTTITTFPVAGTLSTGTYYYETLANAGPATMALTLTPPEGGASMSVSLSGSDCCTAEAYVSASAGTADRIRGVSDPFNIPRRQMLLLTVYVDVAPGRTVSFSLNYTARGGAGSGFTITPPPTPTPNPRSDVIVTPPPSPTPTSRSRSGIIITPPPEHPRAIPPPCTDLSVDQFSWNSSGSTTTVAGVIRNQSPTAFVSPNRNQYIEVLYISNPRPISVKRMGFFEVPASGLIPFSLSFPTPSTSRIRARYRVLIYYNTRALENDRLYTNDDCNAANNSTERQLIAVDRIDP